MNYNDMSSPRDYRQDSVSFSINISSLREFLKQSGTDAMFIASEYAIKLHQSRRDAMIIAPGYNIANEQSRRDEMFIKTILHINHSTNSLINHLTNSPFYQPTPFTYARIL